VFRDDKQISLFVSVPNIIPVHYIGINLTRKLFRVGILLYYLSNNIEPQHVIKSENIQTHTYHIFTNMQQ